MDTAQWPQQGIGVVKGSVDSNQRQTQIQVDRSRVRPHKEQALNCPRCNSTNTKFCYYNNYSLSQPRYFCKTCRRYWTEGGSLRNVPVGGGSRKNKRSSSSSSTSSSSSNSTTTPTLTSSTTPTTTLPPSSSTNLQPSQHMIHTLGNSKFYQGGGHDLNLSFPNQSLSAQELGGSMSALELLRSGISARGLEPFVPAGMPLGSGSLFGASFGFQELMRPSSNNMKLHPLDGVGGSSGFGGSMQDEGDGRLLFPFEDLKQVTMSNGSHEGVVVQGQGDPTLFWNGIMGSSGGGGGGGGNEGNGGRGGGGGGGGGGGSW